jgi:hypothetical protein
MFSSSRIQGITFHTSQSTPPENAPILGRMGLESTIGQLTGLNQPVKNDADLGGARKMGDRVVSLLQQMNEATERIINRVEQLSEYFDQIKVIEPLDPPKNRAIDYIAQLIDEINALSSSITVAGSAPLGKGGKAFQMSLGDGSTMTIDAHDLSMEQEDVKLATAADSAAYSKLISFQMQMGEDVKNYLQEQLSKVEALTSNTRKNSVQSDGDVMNPYELRPDEAIQMASESAMQVLEYGTNILDMSMDSHPQTIAKLLRNPV